VQLLKNFPAFYGTQRFITVFTRALLSTTSPEILYGRETWIFILREEHRLKVSENEELRRIYGPKGEKLTVGWKILHKEELKFFGLHMIMFGC
jgi:hypothetical protein